MAVAHFTLSKQTVTGADEEGTVLTDANLFEFTLTDADVTELRAGDKVMQVRNNYQREVFNGDIGRVAVAGL